MTRGTIQEEKLFSLSLNEEVSLLVYLPATFSPLYKYSVLIAQDGKDYFQFGKIGRTIDELMEKKQIENLMVVGVPYRSVEDRRRKYHPEGEQFNAYIRFLAHELVPYLDQNYPTLQIGNGRGLIGDSLAATVSLAAAMEYPHTFGRVILQSPYVDRTILNTAEQFNEAGIIEIHHSIGSEETRVKTTSGKIEDFLSPNRELSRILSGKGGNYHYHEFDGGHFWTHWQPGLKEALEKIYSPE